MHVVATLLKKSPALLFFSEFTKFDRIPFLYHTFRWLLLFTRASAEKVTNYLFDNAEYENNSDQTQHVAMINVYIKWLFFRKIHRGGSNTRRAPSVDPSLILLSTSWKRCWKDIKLKKHKRKSDGELIFIVKCSLKLKVTLNCSTIFKF